MNTPWHLIDAYLDDDLTADQANELRRWLAADRQHLREFVLAVHQHRSMRAMARLAGKSAVPTRAVEAKLLSQDNEDSVFADLTVANLSWIERCRRRLTGFMAIRRVALGLMAVVMIFAVATWMSWRPTAWTPPVIGLIEGTGVGQVTVEDNRILQHLSRRWTASRFALLRHCGAWLRDSSRELRLRPGDLVRFSPAFGHHGSMDDNQESPSSSLTLTYTNDTTVIRLKENSALKLLASNKGKRYELISGAMEIDAAPQPEKKPLQILTPMARITVMGTKLALAASGRSTRVQVTEGSVNLEPRATQEITPVHAGQRAIAATNKSVSFQALRPITNHYGTGSLLREQWSNLPGRSVQDLTNAVLQTPPTRTEMVTALEKPDTGLAGEDAYGARYRGYLHAPVSGEYTFWVAADDTGEVWLSTDDRPENKRLICQAAEWSRSFRNWWQYPEQESPFIHLEAGQRYYLEALHKEGGGGDFFSVAWQPPGAEMEVITGADLSPFEPVKLARQ